MGKSFKSTINPVMQFISTKELEHTPAKQKEHDAPKTLQKAMPQGHSKPKEQPHKKEVSQTPNGYKSNPAYIETKSRRLQLLLQPTLYEKIKNMAKQDHVSVNELIHTCLEKITQNT